MVAYIIRLSTELFQKHTPFTVRFGFLLLSAGSTYLIYRSYTAMFRDRDQALICALLFNLTPVALLGGSMAMHDNALIFFWIGANWAMAEYLRSRANHWLYYAGAFAGLAMLSKYTGVLLLASLFLFFLLSKRNRSLLVRKDVWIAAGIAACFTLPIIIWNIKHDWASLHHILFIGSGASSVLKKVSDGLGYHLAQFLIVSPLFYFALIYAPLAALIKGFREITQEELLLYCLSSPIVFFAIMAFKGHVEANWAFMAYPSAGMLAVHIIFFAGKYSYSGLLKSFNEKYLKYAILLSVIPVIIVVGHAWIGFAPSWLERRLGKADRIIWETRGWRGLGEHVGRLQRDREVIAGDKYQMCAILEFYTPGHPRVRYLAPWRRPTQFDVWEPSFDNLAGRDILFVTSRKLKPTDESRVTIYENFQEVRALPPYRVMFHKEPIREVYIYRCLSFDPFKPKRLGPRSLFYSE
jgi:4-amino-4-deoxy-L-arabinose transferase-like glycosyltransferase